MSRTVVVSVGVFLLVAAVYAAVAPGRIDMIDGQYRFEVARNLGAMGLVVWAIHNDVRFGSVIFSGKGVNHPAVFGNPLVGLAGLLFSPGTGEPDVAREVLAGTMAPAAIEAHIADWSRKMGWAN